MTSKVLVLYYSSYGHIETMAYAVAEGARSTGATVDVKRVPRTFPKRSRRRRFSNSISRRRSQRLRSLPNYDAIVVGAPTRFGKMPSAMGSFWEQAGALWLRAR